MLQGRLISNKEGAAKDQVLFLSNRCRLGGHFRNQLPTLQRCSFDNLRVYSALYELMDCCKRTLGLKIICP